MRHHLFTWFLTGSLLAASAGAAAQTVNGQLDDPADLVRSYTVAIPMSDSVRLMTDVYLPVLTDDLTFPVSFQNLSGNIVVMRRGTQYVRYPGQPDPFRMPLVFQRTPYNKDNPLQGQIFALLGYGAVVQDMRGRYASEGVYIPMYSDGWRKTPYHSFSSPLDVTGRANRHEDGYESLQFLLQQLRYDSNNDGQITLADRLACNGEVGMFGASALGNAQYALAAAHPVRPAQPGLKCLLPIVASGEFYKSTGFPNGVFRQRVITGWLGKQFDSLQPNVPDPSLQNAIHTPQDYNLSTVAQVQEKAYDAWTELQQASYPNSPVRADLDISQAPVNAAGEGSATGPFSRYRNLDVPIYHLSGWWDIFVDGQIETYRNTISEIAPANRPLQKLVVGPWTHQTIGSREVGDMRGPNQYKANVTDVLKINVQELSSGQQSSGKVLLQLYQSELLQWYRYNLGEPVVVIPANQWQFIDSANSQVQVRLPAQDFQISYLRFINFLNGGLGLDSIPVEVKLNPAAPAIPFFYNVPATGQSVFGDTALTVVSAQPVEFNAAAPGGLPNVRLYVTGPVNDGVAANATAGNYWLSASDFPLPNTGSRTLYLHASGTLDNQLPTAPEGFRTYTHHPDNPVTTVGGGNMLVTTPDGSRYSQGQMNLADPQWRHLTMDSARVLHFQTLPLPDTLSAIGFPRMKLYAKSDPAGAPAGAPTDTDFMVRVLDVYPDGRELFVTEGTVNARARAYAASIAAGQENPAAPFSNIAAGQVYEYDFRMLPLAYTWGRGHRIKVLVSSSNYPRYQSNPNLPLMPGEFFRRQPNDGQTYTFNSTVMSPRVAANAITFSPAEPSQLELPLFVGTILGAAAAPSEAAVQAYPNPTAETITIADLAAARVPYALYNASGTLVQQGLLPAGRQLSLRSLPRGLYLLRLLPEGSKGTLLKVVKN